MKGEKIQEFNFLPTEERKGEGGRRKQGERKGGKEGKNLKVERKRRKKGRKEGRTARVQ